MAVNYIDLILLIRRDEVSSRIAYAAELKVANILFARIRDQRSQELHELVRIESVVNDHPAYFSMIRHGGNHGYVFACAADCFGDRRFAHRGKASTAGIAVDQGRLITPMDLSALVAGTLLDAWVLALKPGLHSLRVLFAGPLDELLRFKALAHQVLAYVAHVQFDALLPLNELAYGGAAPNEKIYLLLAPLVDLLQCLLLCIFFAITFGLRNIKKFILYKCRLADSLTWGIEITSRHQAVNKRHKLTSSR